ncbi:MAG: nucleotidyl transferase AbiEii/AbiGii toxin family protein [Amphiplicatus sp.]
MARERYEAQVGLLLRLLPSVLEEKEFALKGGTAINLFFRDMPRLSVDLDLAFIPVADRTTSLERIDAGLDRIAKRATRTLKGARLERVAGRGGGETRILARQGAAEVKIEVSPVARGLVFPPVMMTTRPIVEEAFGFGEAQVASFADVYGGKIHAALDRQHPRDLFDVKLLLENEGLTDDLVRAALVYLASSSRPLHELLDPHRLDIAEIYAKEFEGMTVEPATLDELYSARERLIIGLHARLGEKERGFLRSLLACAPDWTALGLGDISELPAIRWKLKNLERLRAENPEKFKKQSALLEAAFENRGEA